MAEAATNGEEERTHQVRMCVCVSLGFIVLFVVPKREPKNMSFNIFLNQLLFNNTSTKPCCLVFA